MNGTAVHQELVAREMAFRYERSDIPAGQTLAEWRRSRARPTWRTRHALLSHIAYRTR